MAGVVYVALRGWPFANVASRAVRLPFANLIGIVAGVVTYVILHDAIGLIPAKASAVAAAALTAVLARGMLFEGLPRSGDQPARDRLIMLGTVALAAAALYAALTAIAHQAPGRRRHQKSGSPTQASTPLPRCDPPRRHRPTMAIRPCTGAWPITIAGMLESAPAVRAQRRRQDLERLEPELGGDLALTHGDTDSERLSRSSRATPSATAATRARASSRPARWVAAELPMFAISLILAGPEDLLASRALVEVVPRRSGQR